MQAKKQIKNLQSFLIDVAAKGFFHLLGANGLSKFFNFGSQLILAWIFVAEDLGRIKSMQSFLSVLVVLAGAGFNVSTLKLTSENRSIGEKKILMSRAFRYSIITGIIVYIGFALLSRQGVFTDDKQINALLWIVAIAIIPNVISEIYLSYFQALKKLKSYAYIQLITKIVAVIIVITLSYLHGLYGYVYALLASKILTIAAIFFYKKKYIDKGISEPVKSVDKPLKKHLRYAPYSMLANFSSILSTNLDILLMIFLNVAPELIGYYAFAKIFINILRLAASTVQQSTNPFFSSLADQPIKFLDRFKKYNRIMFITTFTGTIVLALVVPLFIKLLFSAYNDSIPFFLILITGWFFRSNTYLPASALFGLGKISINFFISLAGLLVSAAAMYAGYYISGAIGLAIGMAITGLFLFLANFVAMYYVKRKLCII